MVRSKQGAKVPRSESAEEDQVDSTTTEDKADHKLPHKVLENGSSDGISSDLPDSTENSDDPDESIAIKKDESSVKDSTDADALEKTSTGNADAEAEGAKKKKPTKKVVPAWAYLTSDNKKKLLESSKVIRLSTTKVEDEVLSAIEATADSRGIATAVAIRKYFATNKPSIRNFLIKKALKKAIETKAVKQVKGSGFSGSFKVLPVTNKKAKKSGATNEKAQIKRVSLMDLLPLVFTWVCHPKEASGLYIRRYLAEHFPDLDVDGKKFKNGIDHGLRTGQLKRLTGTGATGTFALIDGAKKFGTQYEDAFETAIIAMNEPKDCSVTAMRDYLSVYHNEYNTDERPGKLRNALEKMERMGFLVRVSGKGFAGTYRLNWPYYPSPKQLWGDEAEERGASSLKKRKRVTKDEVSDSDDDDESEEEEEEEEVVPPPRKRGAPKSRPPPMTRVPPKSRTPAKSRARTAPKKPAPSKKKASELIIGKKSKPEKSTTKKRSRSKVY